MSKTIRYTDAQIEAGRKKLRSLASQNRGKTRAETAEILSADIRKAIKQGYSLKQIHEALAEAGLSVSLARIKALLKTPDENVPPPNSEPDGISGEFSPAENEKNIQPAASSASALEEVEL